MNPLICLLCEKGYHIFSGVVPLELCAAVVRDIDQHTQEGEYGGSDLSGLVEMYHYQSMWDIRQHPEVHKCFSQIFGKNELWVTIDRVCRKVPQKEEEEWPGFIHWDINPNLRPRVMEVQGLVALTDTSVEMGGFQCVPSLYTDLDNFIDKQPTKKIIQTSFLVDENNIYYYGPPSISRMWHEWKEERGTDIHYSAPIEKVEMKAGDLIVWDSYLPHGNGPNRSDKIRYCQYVSMTPVGDMRTRIERIDSWSQNSPPSGLAFFGDPRNIEERKPSAHLTDLGEKLLGLRQWNEKLWGNEKLWENEKLWGSYSEVSD